MTKHRALMTLVLLTTLLLPVAQSRADQYGGYMGEIWRWGVSARALGLGRAFVALADDPSGLFFNPAGLMQQRNDKEVTASFAWNQDIYERCNLGYANLLSNYWAWGANAIYEHAGGFQERDVNDLAGNEFGISHYAVVAGVATDFKLPFIEHYVHGGASIKYDGLSFDEYHQDTWLCDFGIQTYLIPRLLFGSSVQWLLKHPRHEKKDTLDCKLGISRKWTVSGKFILSVPNVEINLNRNGRNKYSFGIECEKIDSSKHSLAGRGGLAVDGNAVSWSFGCTLPLKMLGLAPVKMLDLDLAYYTRGEGFNSLWGTLSYRLGKKRDPLRYIEEGMSCYDLNGVAVDIAKAKRALWHARNMGIDTCPPDSAIKLILIIDREHSAQYMEFTDSLPIFDIIPADIIRTPTQ